MHHIEKHNIEKENIKIIFITNINNLLFEFFEKIKTTDIKLYFMNKDITENVNFNDWVIKDLTEKQINFLKININFSSSCLENLDEKLKNFNIDLDYNTWKICVFSEMFFNLPFTLQDVIFIPVSYIDKSMKKSLPLDFLFTNSDAISKNFSKTLIHEKIHLLQRYNQTNWNNYILSETDWIIFNNEIIFNLTLINNNKIIHNPDTYYVNNNFAYSIDKKYYYGQMLLNSSKEIKNIWYEMIDSNNKKYLYPISHSILKYEHPYEELAYNLSENLIKNTK